MTNRPHIEYIERLEADNLRKVSALAEIIHCIEHARIHNEPIDGERILKIAADAAPYRPTRQPTNPATLISQGKLDA